MPSMHFEYAFVVGVWGAILTEKIFAKILFISYTISVFWAIIVTGNHFVLDGIVAVLLVGIGQIIANQLSEIIKKKLQQINGTAKLTFIYFFIFIGFFAVINLILIKATKANF